MATQLSAGVNFTEVDLTTVVPSVATTDAAIAGIFNWGPIGERVLIDSETKLVSSFGPPNSNNAETWFTAANFLSYANRLYVVRTANVSSTNSAVAAHNAFANVSAVSNSYNVVKNSADFDAKNGTFDSNITYVARYPGQMGNSLKISVCDSANAYSSLLYANGSASPSALDVSANLAIDVGSSTLSLVVTPMANGTVGDANTYATALVANLAIGDYLVLGNTSIGTHINQVANVSSITSNSSGSFATISLTSPYRLSSAFTTNSSVNTTVTRYWEYFNVVNGAPSQSTYQAQFGNSAASDLLHAVVVDQDGMFTGTPGTVLEKYEGLSRATDAKTTGGAANFYKTVINTSSKYVWVVNDRSGAASASAAALASSTNKSAMTLSFTGGSDGYSESTAPLATIASGYDLFAKADDVDISLILQGKPIGGTAGTNSGVSWQLGNYLIDNIAEIRRDVVVFITPDDTVVTSNGGNEALAQVAWRGLLHDSSYAFVDSGYKYMYDRYNDVYRYVPLNGDIAGLCARTDSNRDAWWSPAGFNRGQIKNLVKLRWNPGHSDRDILYKNNINPVVTFPGQGTYLYGDKTLQSKASAFDRINVRRLFIVLEKAISLASKYFLFDFNDEFTRAQFKNMVVPYLRDIQGRRGITDFLVVCDSTNNTAEIVDKNQFVGDIYIKPARSINFIQLNFVAVRSSVQFSEIVGSF